MFWTASPEEVLRRSRALVRARVAAMESEELLEKLPQGPGSGLDADTVDGLHAMEIIAKVPRGSGGGGGGGGDFDAKFYVGASEPSVTFAGMMWVDLSTSPITIRVRNVANASWNTLQELLLEVSI